MAHARGRAIDFLLDGERVTPSPAVAGVPVDDELVNRWGPRLPGFVREALTTPEGRRGLGVHHTPPSVVEEILDLAETCGVSWTAGTTVLDPSVGGGAFLLAAAERMPGERTAIVGRLRGVDVDPLAIATTAAALELWAGAPPRPDAFVVADFLSLDPADVGPVDVVVGNPPFLSQLRGATARSEADRARLAARWPGVGGYADEAAAFAVASTEVISDGGVVALVQPASMLGAVDAGPIRTRLSATAPLHGLWIDRDRRFAAGVDTVALVLARRDPPASVWVEDKTAPPADPESWAPLLSAASGTPSFDLAPSKCLADVAHLTAGFRDQYYGLRGAVDDDPDGAHPLVTSGAIDPLRLRWGSRPTRFDKRSYDHPVVDPDRVDDGVRDWVRARLVPKVLVASQTKVIEAVVDDDGRLVPGTPVVSVEPTDSEIDPWRIVALLTSPVATALLVRVAAGTALSADAVRVSARLLGDLPLPIDHDDWAVAAERARTGDVVGCGEAMLFAHGLGRRSDILDWWTARIPTRSLGN